VRDLAGEARVDPRHLPLHDAELLLEARIVDPEVKAAPAQRIAQLTRAVRGQNHVGRVRGLDRPDLGDGHLPVCEHLEHERLELLVAVMGDDLIGDEVRRTVEHEVVDRLRLLDLLDGADFAEDDAAVDDVA
jgi:hypothetical protein